VSDSIFVCLYTYLWAKRALAGDACIRVHRAIHELIEEYSSRGEYEFLTDGVSLDAIVSRVGDLARSVVEECVDELSEEGKVVVWVDGSKRVLPLEAYQVRSILELVPYIDAKLVVESRRELVAGRGFETISRVAYTLCGDDRSCIELLIKVFNELVREAEFLKTPYRYQEEVWLRVSEEIKGSRRPVVVSAGTGEGKTEAFLIPILLYLAVSRLRGARPRAAIVYPRKALAVDQLARIVHYLRAVNRVMKLVGLEPIKLAIVDGDTRFFWSYRDPDSGKEVAVSRIIHRSIACSRGGAELVVDIDELRGAVQRDLARALDDAAALSREGFFSESALLSSEIRGLKGVVGGRSIGSRWPRLECRDGEEYEDIEWLGLTKSDLLFETPDLLVTNFESLSIRTLDPELRDFFAGLEVLVVDEAHVVRSIRGVYEALAVRRIAALVKELSDREPLLIVSSATLPDPIQLVKAFAPSRYRDAIVIDSSSTEQGFRGSRAKEFVYHLAIIPSGLSPETATTHISILLALSTRRHKVLVFTNRRRDAERIAKNVSDRVSELARGAEGRLGIVIDSSSRGVCEPGRHSDNGALVLCDANSRTIDVGSLESSFHHAGLKRDDRERIEHDFRSGRINVLAATSTLEMGIDVGDVEAVVLHGTPVGEESYRQRVGRGGARGREALSSYIVVTVIDSLSPRDVYFFAHFEDVARGRSSPRKVVDPSKNLRALAQNLALLALAREAQLRDLRLAPSMTSVTRLDPCRAHKAVSEYLSEGSALSDLLKELAPDLEHESLREQVVKLARNTLRAVDSWLRLACGDSEGLRELGKALRGVMKLCGAVALAASLPFTSSRSRSGALQGLIKALSRVANNAVSLLRAYGEDLVRRVFEKVTDAGVSDDRLFESSIRRIAEIVKGFTSIPHAVLGSRVIDSARRLVEDLGKKLSENCIDILVIDALIEELGKISKYSLELETPLAHEYREIPPPLTLFSIVSRAYLLQLVAVFEMGDRRENHAPNHLQPLLSAANRVRREVMESSELVPLQMVWGSRSSRSVKVSGARKILRRASPRSSL